MFAPCLELHGTQKSQESSHLKRISNGATLTPTYEKCRYLEFARPLAHVTFDHVLATYHLDRLRTEHSTHMKERDLWGKVAHIL